MDTKNLTAEQRAELMAQLQAEQQAEQQKKKDDIEAYKEMVSGFVIHSFEMLIKQSMALARVKESIYNTFHAAFEIKADLFGTKEKEQKSHTFSSKEGNLRITLGTNHLDNYDDTADEGIAMVNEYLDELSTNSSEAQQAVKICRSLLAKDKKGTLKASRIMTLRKHAVESGNERFIEGVDIIMNAYKPLPSKQYIRAEYKDDKGAWVNLPLGIT